MSSYISDNDDDLFDYDPTTDVSSTPEITLNTNSSQATFDTQSQMQKDFVDAVKTNLPSNPDADLDESQPTVNAAVSHLYSSFQDAIYSFVGPYRQEGYVKGVHITLDQLTNGHFSLLNMFHYYEMRIARKMGLVKLFGAIFTSDDDTVAPFLAELSSLINFNITPLYYSSAFKSTVRMLNHSLTVDRIIYQHLAGKTKLLPRPLLINDLNEVSLDDIHDEIIALEINTFRKDIYSEIMTAFFSAQPNDQSDTLSQKLADAFNAPVEYHNSYKTM
jgi:hypothetical protein